MLEYCHSLQSVPKSSQKSLKLIPAVDQLLGFAPAVAHKVLADEAHQM